MTSRIGNWLPLLLLLLLTGVTVWLARTVTELPGKGDANLRHDPDMIVENFIAKQFGKDGHVRFTLAARKMVHYPDDETSHLANVKFEAFEQGKPPMLATADTALLTREGDELFLRGNVVLVRKAGPASSELTVRTNYLHVIPDTGIAKTNQPVVLKDSSTVVNAASMLVNNKSQTMSLTRVNAIYEKN
jgi:lipopolysaccharide export system protein LptC